MKRIFFICFLIIFLSACEKRSVFILKYDYLKYGVKYAYLLDSNKIPGKSFNFYPQKISFYDNNIFVLSYNKKIGNGSIRLLLFDKNFKFISAWDQRTSDLFLKDSFMPAFMAFEKSTSTFFMLYNDLIYLIKLKNFDPADVDNITFENKLVIGEEWSKLDIRINLRYTNIAMDKNSHIFMTSYKNKILYKIDTNGKFIADTKFNHKGAIFGLFSVNNYVYIYSHDDETEILKYNLLTQNFENVELGKKIYKKKCVADSGNRIICSANNNNNIYMFNEKGGLQNIFGKEVFKSIKEIFIDNNDRLFVIDQKNNDYKIYVFELQKQR